MVTCLYFLSLFFQAVLLELEDGLDDVMQLFLCDVCGLIGLKNLCVMRIFYVECLICGNMCLSFGGVVWCAVMCRSVV